MTNPTGATFVTLKDAEAVADEAAKLVVTCISANPGRPAICLTGGTGPRILYRLLGSTYRHRIPWADVHWFMGDERSVSSVDELNNMRMARHIFLDQWAPMANIHPIPTDAADPDSSARLYESTLQSFYGSGRLNRSHPLFDVVLMGLGPDGHTASLFPGNTALEERNRWVVGVEHANVEPFVPRVTLTYPALASCRQMLFLVSGHGKRDILSRVKAGDDLPATRARSDGNTNWLVDAAAMRVDG
jgi:6-phosphogluconolactonase